MIWYCAHFDDFCEDCFEKRLAKKYQGVCVWVPKKWCYALIDGRLEAYEEPVCPSYFLLGSDLSGEEVEAATGFSLLRVGRKHVEVSKKDLDWFRDASESVFWPEIPIFEKGEKVWIRDDARSSYAGFLVEFCESFLNTDRRFVASVRVDFYGVKIECLQIYYDQIAKFTNESLSVVGDGPEK